MLSVKMIIITIIDKRIIIMYNTDIQETKCQKNCQELDNKNKSTLKREMTMKKYECEPCGYIYDPAVGDPDAGIAPETAFEDIPDDWTCPICGLGKDVFVPVED